ncbi:MAG: mechanosensitive ion channel [Caldilineales bacterium]
MDIGPFVFSLLEVGDGVTGPRQSTGRIVQIPNAYIFTHKLVNENMAFEFIWHEIPVVVTFESDWQRAKVILEQVVRRHAGEFAPAAEQQLRKATDQFMVKTGTLEPTVYTRVVDIGVELTMRFLCEVRKPRVLEHVIWEDVLLAFAAEPAIDFAYPTTRIYRNDAEGKPGAGGPAHHS